MTPQLQQAIKLLQMSNLELQAFVDSVHSDTPPTPGIEDGVRAFVVADAATQSRIENRWIGVS